MELSKRTHISKVYRLNKSRQWDVGRTREDMTSQRRVIYKLSQVVYYSCLKKRVIEFTIVTIVIETCGILFLWCAIWCGILFLWTETKRKKRTWPISSYLDRTSLINKGFIIWPKDCIKIAKTKRAIPSGRDRPILPTRVANQNAGFALSCPLEKISSVVV